MATTDRDIFRVLPLEIAQRCIAEACEGNQYMASLLALTMVSKDWRRILMQTPTLWATVHINDADEDSVATIALFLHLACNVRLSLSIWIPLSEGWNTISPILSPRRDQIHKITLRTDSGPHSAECRYKTDISDATIQHNLREVFKKLGLPTSVECLDVILDRPISIDSTWIPPNLASTGNWLIPLTILESSYSFPKLYYLSMKAIDLPTLFPYLSVLGRLQHLHLHSEEQDYINPPPHPPPPKTSHMAPLHIPTLKTLWYHGRLYWASMQLLTAAAQTIQNLDLHIGVLDLSVAMNALAASKSLRRFSLTLLRLEYDLDASNKRRFYLPMNITNLTARIKTPNRPLTQVEDFRCEMKPFGSGQMSGNVDLDHLWQYFHTIFPEILVLVWHLPIQSDKLLILLVKQKRLRYFESDMVLAPSSRQLPGLELSSLESLRIKDAQMFHGMVIPNLVHLSATCLENFEIPAGFTFTQLRSLDIDIGENVEALDDMSNADFPLLKVLSVTFLGPHGDFPLPNLSSLMEITISTKSPTFTQGMKFCASLICEPCKYPHLEQINLDSFLEWDLLYLMLRRRNFLQHPFVSRIKTLTLPLLLPKFRPMFGALLEGRHISSVPLFWSSMIQLSIQGGQSRLLDSQIMGCFNCVYWGLGDCLEPLQPSRLTKETHTSHGGGRALSDILQSLGVSPLHSWDMKQPVDPMLWIYENIWMIGHQKRVEMWRNEAYAWSKLHHRTLTCHKWCCNLKAIVSLHDMEGDHSGPVSSPAFFNLSKYAEFCDPIGAAIPLLIRLLQDPDREIRSTTAFMLTELAAHSELRDTIRTIPSIIELLQNEDYVVRSSTVVTLAKLVGRAEFRQKIEAVTPSLIEQLKNSNSNARSTAASALGKLAQHAEFRNAIHPAIPFLVQQLRDNNSYVRSTAASALTRLAQHASFRDGIHVAIPSLAQLLKDRHSSVRSTAASAITKLAGHIEFRNAIQAIIPFLVEQVRNVNSNDRNNASFVLAELARHTGFGNAVEAIIPSLGKLLNGSDSNVASTAASAIAKLAEHIEFRNAIQAVIPLLVKQLRDVNSSVRNNAALVLVELAKYSEFRDLLHPAMPSLIWLLLEDGDVTVRSTAASMVAKLAQHTELGNAIEAFIPSLVKLLNDSDSNVASTAASVLATLAESAGFRDAVESVIPPLIELLGAQSSSVDARFTAAYALTTLAGQSGFRKLIHGAVAVFVALLRYHDFLIRYLSTSKIAELAEYTEFRNAIRAAIPFLFEQLGDINFNVRNNAAFVLAELAKYSEFRNLLHPALSLLIRLLKDGESTVRATAASTLVKLTEHTELRDAIRAAIPSLTRLLRDEAPRVQVIAADALAQLAKHGLQPDIVMAYASQSTPGP